MPEIKFIKDAAFLTAAQVVYGPDAVFTTGRRKGMDCEDCIERGVLGQLDNARACSYHNTINVDGETVLDLTMTEVWDRETIVLDALFKAMSNMDWDRVIDIAHISAGERSRHYGHGGNVLTGFDFWTALSVEKTWDDIRDIWNRMLEINSTKFHATLARAGRADPKETGRLETPGFS